MAEGLLIAVPQEHFADEGSAKVALEPLLRSWETAAFLSKSRYRTRFKYDHADVVDRNPTPGVVTIYAHSAMSAFAAGIPSVFREIYVYPSPRQVLKHRH